MYSRSYLGVDERNALPDNYDGVAFFEAKKPDACVENSEKCDSKFTTEHEIEANKTPWEEPKSPTQNKPDNDFLGISKLPFLNAFSGIFGSGNGFSLSNIGTEEILIIAASAFLFLSKDGDNECAVMLLLLLLIR